MKTQLSHYQQRVEAKLSKQLESLNAPSPLKEAFIYSTLNQGKRIRPALVYAIADALKIPLNQVDAAAMAIELIHCYSLVHDDLPAMDDDNLRRGKPTCHIQFDEATAILVGDAQQTLAFEVLSQSPLPAQQVVKQIQLLAQASGAEGMVAGQVLDMQAENRADNIPLEQLKTLHLCKTGALLKTALLLGAIPAPNFEQLAPSLNQLGEQIGLAFQVHDDILDIESNTETLGKPQGSDLAANKTTYPKLLGLEGAKTMRDQLIQQAHYTLKNLPFQSHFLHQLIDYIAERKH